MKAGASALPHALAFLAGFATCLAIVLVTGRKEAWDSPLYFLVGLPLMCVAAGAIAFRFPERSWRWGIGMAVGQSIAMALGAGSLTLWPLALVAMTVLSIPEWVTAVL